MLVQELRSLSLVRSLLMAGFTSKYICSLAWVYIQKDLEVNNQASGFGFSLTLIRVRQPIDRRTDLYSEL